MEEEWPCSRLSSGAGQGPGNGGIFIVIYCCITIHGCILPPCSQLWLTFAPIPDFTAEFYNVSEDDVNLFSLVFFVVSLVIGLFSIVVLDTWGLKVSVSFGLHPPSPLFPFLPSSLPPSLSLLQPSSPFSPSVFLLNLLLFIQVILKVMHICFLPPVLF